MNNNNDQSNSCDLGQWVNIFWEREFKLRVKVKELVVKTIKIIITASRTFRVILIVI